MSSITLGSLFINLNLIRVSSIALGTLFINLNLIRVSSIALGTLFINLNLIQVSSIALGTLFIHLNLIQVSSIALGSLKSFSNDDSELNEEIVTLAFENGINFFDISEPFTSQKAEVNYSRLGKELNTSLVIWFNNLYTFATWCCGPFITHAINSTKPKSHSLKYQRFTSSGFNDL